jgi:hypothetical protein
MEIFLKFARFSGLPVVEFIKTEYRSQKPEFRRKETLGIYDFRFAIYDFFFSSALTCAIGIGICEIRGYCVLFVLIRG